jgi:hypothetical protein
MYRAFILVDHFEAGIDTVALNFKNFRLWRARYPRELGAITTIFPDMPLDHHLWVLEIGYQELPPLPEGADPWVEEASIGFHLEDLLLFFRLFKAGDVSFIQRKVVRPDETDIFFQPYRAMSPRFNSTLPYRFGQDEISAWQDLATDLPQREAWNSIWFKRARRFFLNGGGIEYNTYFSELDRIVEYMSALEVVLVPEKDFYIGSRLRNRACALLNLANEDKREASNLLREFYNIRSTIIHGSPLREEQLATAGDQREAFEQIVRDVLKAAIRVLPSDDEQRQEQLQAYFDVTDADRASEIQRLLKEMSDDRRREVVALLKADKN